MRSKVSQVFRKTDYLVIKRWRPIFFAARPNDLASFLASDVSVATLALLVSKTARYLQQLGWRLHSRGVDPSAPEFRV